MILESINELSEAFKKLFKGSPKDVILKHLHRSDILNQHYGLEGMKGKHIIVCGIISDYYGSSSFLCELNSGDPFVDLPNFRDFKRILTDQSDRAFARCKFAMQVYLLILNNNLPSYMTGDIQKKPMRYFMSWIQAIYLLLWLLIKQSSFID